MKTPTRFEFDIITDHLINRRGALSYRQPVQTVDPARAAAAYRHTARACAIHDATTPAAR